MTAGRPATSDPTVREIRRLAWLLDESIRLPGGYRIGLDGIIGIVPGIGDLVGVAASSYILFRARQFGVPRVVMVRMAANVFVEMIIGMIPLLGDLFDFLFKANQRNVALMEKYFTDRQHTHASSWGVVLLGITVGVAVLIAAFYVTYRLIRQMLILFAG